MRAVKGAGTGPERRVRTLIWSLGGRYRLNRADLPGKPDIVMAGRRLAVFVHGCFWHGHDCPRGARIPKANRPYWTGKIAANRARDAAARTALETAGWRVETVWECDLKDEAALAARIEEWLESPHLRSSRRKPGPSVVQLDTLPKGLAGAGKHEKT